MTEDITDQNGKSYFYVYKNILSRNLNLVQDIERESRKLQCRNSYIADLAYSFRLDIIEQTKRCLILTSKHHP